MANTIVLIYWLLIWLKSYRSYRDVISLLVFLFVLQSFLGEAWVMIAGYFSVSGHTMRGMMLYGNYVVQLIMLVILTAIYYFVRKLE